MPKPPAFSRRTAVRALAAGLSGVFAATVSAAAPGPKDLGAGFVDHGVASPISHSRGTVATVDGHRRDVVLAWLFDHRGGYGLLLVDCTSGRSEQFPMPFEPEGDTPYASILSSGNRFYTLFNGHFVEFDPVKRAFTFSRATMPKMAMAFTEDDHGVIWAVTYPKSGLVAFDPATRQLTDYGSAYDQTWPQYTRYLAADDTGWIYFGLGNASSQIVMFDPRTRRSIAVFADPERRPGTTAHLYRDMNGKVYGQAKRSDGEQWYELYAGHFRRVEKPPAMRPKPLIARDQTLFHGALANGRRLTSLDLVQRELVITDEAGTEKRVPFDYTTDGAAIMGVATAPDGTVCGGTAFPMRFFSFNPRDDRWINRPAFGQFNTLARQGSRFYFGGYTHGFLLEWDPAQRWVDTRKGAETNPRLLTECDTVINRPHRLLAHPDGKTLILAGTPGYGLTGGGLLLWNRETLSRTLLTHTDLIPEHSTVSLVALPDGKLLGGSTTEPGTGGLKKATIAELYALDLATQRVEWHQPLLPGVQEYTDLTLAPGGLVYGVADRKTFFVFDPAARKIVRTQDLAARFGATTADQCPRVFVATPSGDIFLLMRRGIARVDAGSQTVQPVADSPVPITCGGDFLDGRIYFGSESHLVSFTLHQ